MNIKKYQQGNQVKYTGLLNQDLKLQNPLTPQLLRQSTLQSLNPNWGQSYLQQVQSYIPSKSTNTPSLGKQLGSSAITAATQIATDKLSNEILGNDSELGRGIGTLFSSGISSAGNTMANNLLKGNLLMEGVGKNASASLAGAGAGLVANYLGQGINFLGGNSMLSRGIGQGIATGLGSIGGTAAQAAIQGTNLSKALSSTNPYGLAMTVAGSALGAAFGPSKEYSGKYGNVTKTMDTIYDGLTGAVGLVPGGQVFAGAMALNKGLSNLFGSTSGMTKQDAILGSAFMLAPVKWLNMAGAKTTGTFNNQSWQNTEKVNSFMGNAFGNLSDRFDQARQEAGKTYGTFSKKAYNKASGNLDFANDAWNTVLNMADQNEIQNIRSQYMSSINNQRYAQTIQGGWNPLYRGKQGMKIFNNATNHNIGMRLLSGAALIDNKQMILCSVQD